MIDATTPLMQQYQSIKSRYPHALLLFRLGDFYELFYEDAILASRELQITLTSRNREKGQPIPMCGVPYHSADGYIARLIRSGFKVAICDQMELPGPGKKLVRREVVRVITPGTATDVAVLDAKENNFLASVFPDVAASTIGLAFVDLSTGEFQCTELSGPLAEEALRDELQLLHPRETLLPRPAQLFETAKTSLLDGTGGVESRIEDWAFQHDYAQRILKEQFGVAELTSFGLDGHPHALAASGAIVHYLRENAAKGSESNGSAGYSGAPTLEALRHLDRVRYYEQHDALVLDPVSVRNLELLTPIFSDDSGKNAPTTLVAALDVTVTGMGARLLRTWILRPLIERNAIEERLDAVAHFVQQTVVRGEIRKELRGIQDLERLTSRITLGQAGPRELVALRKSLAQLPVLRNFVTPAPAGGSILLRRLHDEIDELADVRETLDSGIADEPPALASDPGMIRPGFHAELDELRDLSQHSKQIIASMEERERKRTGIGSLKIRFNQVFGYYIEISRANFHLAPADYERKQTLVNAERFTSPELKDYERKVLAADERIIEIERQLFVEIRSSIAAKAARLRRTAAAVAQLDVLSCLAKLAADRGYIRPEFNDAGEVLTRGRSTFLVEMSEVASILTHATAASLVLLDEVGRGTATFDGLSIAWAVVEHLQKHTRARTLFATHYHELTELADLLPAVKNVHVSVKETPNEIIFLRHVEPGSASKSYGIEVARLAGLPRSVIERAREVLKKHELSEHELSERLTPSATGAPATSSAQDILFTPIDREVLDRLRSTDLDHLTPIDALTLLAALKKQIN